MWGCRPQRLGGDEVNRCSGQLEHSPRRTVRPWKHLLGLGTVCVHAGWKGLRGLDKAARFLPSLCFSDKTMS